MYLYKVRPEQLLDAMTDHFDDFSQALSLPRIPQLLLNTMINTRREQLLSVITDILEESEASTHATGR